MALKLVQFLKTAQTQLILPPERESIWKITQLMVPNINGTMRLKIKTRNHPRHGIQCVIEY